MDIVPVAVVDSGSSETDRDLPSSISRRTSIATPTQSTQHISPRSVGSSFVDGPVTDSASSEAERGVSSSSPRRRRAITSPQTSPRIRRRNVASGISHDAQLPPSASSSPYIDVERMHNNFMSIARSIQIMHSGSNMRNVNDINDNIIDAIAKRDELQSTNQSADLIQAYTEKIYYLKRERDRVERYEDMLDQTTDNSA